MLEHVQTFWGADLPAAGQVSRVFETIGAGGQPELVVFDAGSNSYMVINLTAPLAGAAQITEQVLQAGNYAFWLPVEGGNQRIDSFALAAAQLQDSSVPFYLHRNGFAGNDAAVLRYDQGGQSFFVISRSTGDGLTVYRMDTARDFVPVQTISDQSNLTLSGVTATCLVTVGGKQFVVAGSQYDSGFTVLAVSATGTLVPTSIYGAAQGVPVRHVTNIETVAVGGISYVIGTAAGTSSVSVMSIDAAGTLRLTDHLIDTRDTRFGGATALDTIRVGAEVYVAVGGGDGGITVLQLLPGGRLVVREVVEDTLSVALNGVRQLEFVEVNGRVELFVVSNEGGISRYRLDTGPLGVEAVGLQGTSGNDVLSAPNSGGTMVAGAGADVLISGPGADTLRGGTGADLFVMLPGGPTDTIADFQPGQDRIDLSRFTQVRGWGDVTIQSRGNDVVIRIGSEEILVQSFDGRPLDHAQVRAGLIINEGTGSLPVAVPQASAPAVTIPPPPPPPTPGVVLQWRAGQTGYTGGEGFDTLDLSAATGWVHVDLADGRNNAGLARGVSLSSIEALIGTSFNDTLSGDGDDNHISGGKGSDRLYGEAGNDTLIGGDGADYLYGGPGQDRLEGGDGNDWIVPGLGNDTIFGGAGIDIVSYGTAPRGVNVNLTTGRVTDAGGMVDQLSGIENISGSRFDDTLMGDADANWLRGNNGRDHFIATTGNDTYDGGGSTDTVTYEASTSGVAINLTTGRGTAGLASGHSYIEIERVFGSEFSDTLTGSSGRDFLSGRGGDDFIFATAGNDNYYGGSGEDTVDYSASDGAVRIYLNLKYGEGAIAERHTLVSIENVIGSRFDDRLSGTASDNFIYGGAGNDTLMGYGGNDVLHGGAGNDNMFGHEGNDRFFGGAGNDRIFGGSGTDTAVFSGRQSEYSITRVAGGEVRVEHIGGSREDGVDALFSIEQLQFSDGILIL